MAWNYRKRMKIAPGVHLNFSKGGVSTSVGPKRFRFTFGKNGTYFYTSIPKTGLYYRQKISDNKQYSIQKDKNDNNNSHGCLRTFFCCFLFLMGYSIVSEAEIAAQVFGYLLCIISVVVLFKNFLCHIIRVLHDKIKLHTSEKKNDNEKNILSKKPMKSIEILYKQFYNLSRKIRERTPKDFNVNLLQYGISREYYNQVTTAADLLEKYYSKYLVLEEIEEQINDIFHTKKDQNVKFALLIDVFRCYDGMNHPTSFTTPEGIALMIFIGKILGMGEISLYELLEFTRVSTLSLIDIIPYINNCSEELGNRYSLFLSPILYKYSPETDCLYRKLIYNFCKKVAAVDGNISASEQEWLNEIALLNDDDPDNDIDVSEIDTIDNLE